VLAVRVWHHGRACGHCMPMRQGQPVRGHACGANATHDSDAAMGSRLPLPLHLRCLTCVAGGHPIWLQLKSRQLLVDCGQ